MVANVRELSPNAVFNTQSAAEARACSLSNRHMGYFYVICVEDWDEECDKFGVLFEAQYDEEGIVASYYGGVKQQ